ncbi:TonB-dependent receptor, partial [bacterium]|nr:TonB-dependent receptor [bacterium]
TFNELFGSNLSNRISLVYQLDEDKSLKFFAGESYRSPSILELYLKTVRNLLFGNLNLLPAVSRSYEISYLQKKDNVFFQVSSFLSSYTNKISRVKKTGIIDSLGGFFAGTSNVYSNVSKFNSEGFELEVKFKHPKNRGISSFINYSYICGDDGDRDAQGQYNFKFVPKHNFSLGLDTGLTERLLLSILVKYVDDTNDFQGNIIKETSILDLNLIYNNPTNGSRHAFSIKNLFNQEVYIPDYTRLGTNGGQFTQVRNPISNQQIIYSYQWNF